MVDCVSDEMARQFRTDGVTVVRNAFSPDWMAVLAKGLEKNLKNPGKYRREYTPKDGPGQFFGDYCNWMRIPEYEDFARNSPAADIAKALMGTKKVNLFHEHVVVKEPGTKDPTPWHHDQPYYCVDGHDTVSLWIPLDPVPKERGVEFIKGSHKWGRWFIPTKFTGSDYARDDAGFETIPDIESERDKYDIFSTDLQVGDCVAFNFLTVHGAPGNASSDTRRRAVAFRWCGDDVRFVIRKGEMSPPFLEFDQLTLKPGDPLDSDLFPVMRDSA